MKVFIFSVFVACVSWGSDNTLILDWKTSVELAEKNSLELQAAQQLYISVQEQDKTAWSGFLPKINASATGQHSKSADSPSTHSYGADITYTQNLFAGFADYASYRTKKLNTQQAAIELQTTKARLSQELKQIYAEAYFTQANIKLSESILQRRIENLQSVKLQYEVGRENKGSLLLSESNVEQARLDLLRAQNEAETVLENFRRILGLSPDVQVLIQNNIPGEDPAALQAPVFDEMVEAHIQIQKLKNEESLAEALVATSRAQFLPSLDFSAGYGYTDDHFFPERDKWNMGLTLSVPLFNGLRDLASYRTNTAKKTNAQLQLKNTRLSLKKDLKRAYYDYIESLQKEKVDASFNKASSIRAEISRKQYKNGLVLFDEWDRIENEMILRQKEVLTSEKNRIIKQSQWEKAQATGVFK